MIACDVDDFIDRFMWHRPGVNKHHVKEAVMCLISSDLYKFVGDHQDEMTVLHMVERRYGSTV